MVNARLIPINLRIKTAGLAGVQSSVATRLNKLPWAILTKQVKI